MLSKFGIPASATGKAHRTPFLQPLVRASALVLALVAGSLPLAVVARDGSPTPRLFTPGIAGSSSAEEASLHASDGGTSDFLGWSVALSGDTALVGAWQQVGKGDEWEGVGAAYVYTRESGVWTEQAKLIPSERPEGTAFGWSVAIEDDLAVIGRICHPVAISCTAPGAAYVFLRDGAVWREHAKLVAPDGVPEHNNFGHSVAISGDTVLVGAPYAGPGVVYAFTFDGGPSEPVKLVASDGAAGDLFGVSVALSGDTALVGASFNTVGGDASRGAAYAFVRDGDGWSERAKLVASDGAAGDEFGSSVALSGPMAPTGFTALVGAPFATVNGNAWQGAAYTFAHDGAGLRQKEKLVARDGMFKARFGNSVAVQGNVIVIGAPGHQNEPEHANGTAYVYARASERWRWISKSRLVPSESTFQLGASVALSGDTAILGAPTTTVNGMPGRGAAYVFRAGKKRRGL